MTVQVILVINLLISILIGRLLGRNRFIGFWWTIVFGVFCTFLWSLIVSLLSKKRDKNIIQNEKLALPFIGLILNFLVFFGKTTSEISNEINSLVIPLRGFLNNIPFKGQEELISYKMGGNFLIVGTIYLIYRSIYILIKNNIAPKY